jgi:hypothetical protein
MQSGEQNWPMTTVLYLEWSIQFLQNKWPAQGLTWSKKTPNLFNQVPHKDKSEVSMDYLAITEVTKKKAVQNCHALHKTYNSKAYINMENKTRVLYDTELRGKYTARAR